MYLKQSISYKNRIYLSFVQGYRDENGKVKTKTIEKIGFLDDLKNKYDDPVSYFKKLAKEKNNEEIKEITLKNIHTKLIDDSSSRKNLGYCILKKIYNEISLKDLFTSKQKHLGVDYNLNSIFELLIYSRIMYPASKYETYNNKDIFFDKFDFSLKDLYRSLDNFSSFKDDILSWVWNNTKDKYNRDTSTTYYDCTNYYFEISYNDKDLIDEFGNVLEKGYRKKGPSKENRKDPIIGMGLLMDKSGIPLSYDLFPGNESEKTTLRPILKKTKNHFKIDRTIIVADRGLNTSDNTIFIAHKNDDKHTNHDGYVYGQSILSSDKDFKDWVLKKDDYISDIIIKNNEEITFIHKSRIFAKTVQIKKDGKRTNKSNIYQKQMVYYSKKYANKQKYERDLIIAKANDLISNPGKYNKATSYGASAFINNIKYDKKTGLIPDGLELSLDINKIKELEQFDGYYSIVTSELNMQDIEMRYVYKGLWKIEESFKITKSYLESRPVYVWTKNHIEAHFLTCFISLVIIRLLEQKTNNNYSPKQLINSLKNYNSINVEYDLYLQSFRNDIIKDLETIYDIDLSKKYLTLSNIKNKLNTQN